MTDIIDFKSKLMEKECDENCKITMPDGGIWFKYSTYYDFDGKTYSMDFWAENDSDAENRISAMKETMKLEGRQLGSI